MSLYDTAHALAGMIRESEAVQECARLKQIAEEDQTNRTLIAEYKRLQISLQMRALSAPETAGDDAQRFSKIASLLYMNSDTAAYLMAEMRVSQMLADLVKILTEATGLNMELPGM
ncbi:MAG: YlbF family regulator [Clostridia bacterium]|nr:YlbF family regulator [Clostridia bacterium]